MRFQWNNGVDNGRWQAAVSCLALLLPSNSPPLLNWSNRDRCLPRPCTSLHLRGFSSSPSSSSALLPFCPECPWWPVRKGGKEGSLHAFKKLTHSSVDTNQLLVAIEHITKLEEEAIETATWADCFKGSNLRRTAIATTIYSPLWQLPHHRALRVLLRTRRSQPQQRVQLWCQRPRRRFRWLDSLVVFNRAFWPSRYLQLGTRRPHFPRLHGRSSRCCPTIIERGLGAEQHD